MEQQSEEKSTSIVKLIDESGLEKQTVDLLKEQLLPFAEQALTWRVKAESIVVTDISQTDLMKQARDMRLALVKVRTGADKTRKDLKSSAKKQVDLIDSIGRVIQNLIEPVEEYLDIQEKFKERYEKEQADKLFAERLEALKPYCDASLWRLAEMPLEQYEAVLAAEKLKYEKKVETEKAEALYMERVEALKIFKDKSPCEKLSIYITNEEWEEMYAACTALKKQHEAAEAEEARKKLLFDERMIQIRPLYSYYETLTKNYPDYTITVDTTEEQFKAIILILQTDKKVDEDTKEENRKKLALLEKEKQEKEALDNRFEERSSKLLSIGLVAYSQRFEYKDLIFDKIQIRDMNQEHFDKLFKTASSRMKEIQEVEKAEILAKKKIEDDKAAKLKELEDKVKKETAARELLEKQAKIKKDQEAKETADKLKEEKKAAKQPDKVQLKKWIETFELTVVPGIKTDEGKDTYVVIDTKFRAFKTWALGEVEKM